MCKRGKESAPTSTAVVFSPALSEASTAQLAHTAPPSVLSTSAVRPTNAKVTPALPPAMAPAETRAGLEGCASPKPFAGGSKRKWATLTATTSKRILLFSLYCLLSVLLLGAGAPRDGPVFKSPVKKPAFCFCFLEENFLGTSDWTVNSWSPVTFFSRAFRFSGVEGKVR